MGKFQCNEWHVLLAGLVLLLLSSLFCTHRTCYGNRKSCSPSAHTKESGIFTFGIIWVTENWANYGDVFPSSSFYDYLFNLWYVQWTVNCFWDAWRWHGGFTGLFFAMFTQRGKTLEVSKGPAMIRLGAGLALFYVKLFLKSQYLDGSLWKDRNSVTTLTLNPCWVMNLQVQHYLIK